jgi:hypothetical protein
MTRAWNGLWSTLAFLSELAALAALPWWGATRDKVVVFAGAVLALVALGHPVPAGALGAVALLSSVLSRSPDAGTVSRTPTPRG